MIAVVPNHEYARTLVDYLNLKKNCSISDLKNALEKVSSENKENLLQNNIFKFKDNIPSKKSVVFLDNLGKKIFNLKSTIDKRQTEKISITKHLTKLCVYSKFSSNISQLKI